MLRSGKVLGDCDYKYSQNDMTIDSLKVKWRNLDVGTPPRGDEPRTLPLSRERLDRGMTLSSRLHKRYLSFGIFSFIFPFLITPLCYCSGFSITFIVIYTVAMFVAGGFNLTIARRVKRVDLFSIPVIEAGRRAVKLRRYIMRTELVSTIVAIPLIAMLFVEIARVPDEGVLLGAIIGGCVGGVIAVFLLRHTYRQLKELAAVFADTD